eukprot:3791912-Pyramimonas_sp.AAC.1
MAGTAGAAAADCARLQPRVAGLQRGGHADASGAHGHSVPPHRRRHGPAGRHQGTTTATHT